MDDRIENPETMQIAKQKGLQFKKLKKADTSSQGKSRTDAQFSKLICVDCLLLRVYRFYLFIYYFLDGLERIFRLLYDYFGCKNSNDGFEE